MKQYVEMRAKQAEEYQELHEAIEYTNERQGNLLVMMERRQMLMRRAPEDLRRKTFQDIRVFDERISVEEIDLLEKKHAMMELLKKRMWRSGGTQLLLGVGISG